MYLKTLHENSIKTIVRFVLLLTCSFCIDTSHAQFNTLLHFEGTTNGSYPDGSLISDGTFLYGMTRTGGTNDLGTIFKILPDGTGYVKLLEFTGIGTGSRPLGDLYYDGTYLYGMTEQGGLNNKGTIFKIMPDGSGFLKLLDFAGISNGSAPYGTLVSDGIFLYGMTFTGGSNDIGTVFKIMPDGTGFVKLMDFDGASNGRLPEGSLFYDGTFLYGMTYQGGTNNLGTLFKILPNGTGYIKLLDFDGPTNGGIPLGSLISDGTFLYGMTRRGGANDWGTIFKILPDGTGYLKLLDFSGVSNGRYPHGDLISDGTFLYGMTANGGANDVGTIFKILPDGTGYVKLWDFENGIKGSWPFGSLYIENNFLYGMTSIGGMNDFGKLFKYCLTSIEAPIAFVNQQPTCTTPTGSISTIAPLPVVGITYTISGTVPYVAPFTNTTGMFTGLSVGDYELTTSTNECTSAATTLTINPIPGLPLTIDASPISATIQQGETVQLNATGAITYIWTPTAGLSDSTISNPIASPTTTTTYIVTGLDSAGCSGVDSTIITVNFVCGDVFVPTVFSPNDLGPSENNTLCIYSGLGCIKQMSLSIFNLWGEKVFETNDQNVCWDGKYKDHAVNSGIYAFKLILTLIDNTSTVLSGNITLVR